MKRSALIVAALAAAVAAIFVVGVGGASGSPPPSYPSSMAVFVSIGDGQATEGTTGPMHITVQRAFGTSIVLPFDLYWETVSGGTATQGFDYAYQNGEYENLSASIDCNVGSKPDNIYEPNRTFKVHIWSPDPWVVITKDTGTFTIVDDDPVPTVSIGNAPTITEGQSLVYPITLSNPSYLPVSVNLVKGAGTSANFDDNDITGHSTTTPTIAAYGTSTSFVVNTKDDAVYEGSETLVVHVSSATNATIGTANGTGIVNDNDPMPVVHMSVPDHVHHGTMMNFTFTLDRQSQLPVTVNFDRIVIGHGSSAFGLSVSFASLVTTGTYAYNPHLDHWWDVAAVTVHLTGATNATLPGGTANYAVSGAIW